MGSIRRYQALYEKGAVSEQTVDNYRFARNNVQGKLSEAQGVWDNMQDKLSGASVTAPQDGIISKRYYQEGYYAKGGTALFNIADISELTAKINIPEGQISNIAVGGLADITVPAYPDDKFSGMITRISPVAYMPARTFAAEVTVDNSAGKLRGGVYANVVITAEPKENALVIPMSAIVMREDQRTVFVVDDDGVVSRRVLTIGFVNDNMVEVLDGLSDGDRIVTGGQNKLREGSKIKLEGQGAK